MPPKPDGDAPLLTIRKAMADLSGRELVELMRSEEMDDNPQVCAAALQEAVTRILEGMYEITKAPH